MPVGVTRPATLEEAAVSVGQRIYARRITLDMTREDLAQAAQSSPLLIFAYELGQGLPTPPDMRRIAQALQTSIGFFFQIDPAEGPEKTSGSPAPLDA